MQFTKPHKLVFFGFTCCYLFSASIAYCVDGVTMKGVMEKRAFVTETNGTVTPQWDKRFSFIVSISKDGRWAIQVNSLQEKDTIYLTFDGEDTYFVRYQEKILGITNGTVSVVAVKPIDQQVSTAYISSGNYPFVPYDEEERGNLLWLVYGSGNYIHNLKTNTMPLPWATPRWTPLAYGFRFEDELTSTSPYFPHYLKFIRDSKLDLKDDEEMNRPELDGKGPDWISHLMSELQERKNKFPDGYVRAELKVSDFTNYSGMELPIAFIFEANVPVFNNAATLSSHTTGKVTNVDDLDPNESFYPPILGTLSVGDSRFRYQDQTHKLDVINYGLRVGEKWKQKSDPILQVHFREDLGNLPASALPLPSEIKKRHFIVMGIVLLLVLLFPLGLYVIASRKRRE